MSDDFFRNLAIIYSGLFTAIFFGLMLGELMRYIVKAAIAALS